jgi:hypothetical protein
MANADRQWHYAEDGRQRGPVSSAQLKAMADSRQITPETLVWTDGMADWKPAREFSRLFPDEAPIGIEPEPPPIPRAPPTSPGVIARQRPTGDVTGGLIPYKNPAALAAYYLGIFSFIPILGLPLGVIAFFLGIAGLRARSRQPQIKGAVHAWIGIVIGGLFSLVWSLVLLIALGAIALP